MRTAVLLSGGVDSSVALRRLHEEGCDDLIAFYLKVWLEDELAFLGSCPWEEDLAYAREVCAPAGVPLEVVPMQREYWERVVAYAIEELRAGRTPSPDVFCNRRIKFGAFLDHLGGGFERVASGHYARVVFDGGAHRLLKGVDPVKDQTYFLAFLDQRQLARCVFPVGGLLKREVRRLAAAYGLPNCDRPDSQGICFLGRIRFDEFVEHHLGVRAGEIRELETGRKLGEHRGYWFHTIGQRRGLGLGGGPWFVVKKDVAENVVYVSHGARLEDVSRDRFEVGAPHWIAQAPRIGDGVALSVKLRHGERVYGCRLAPAEGGSGGRMAVALDGRDSGVAAGQLAVFYDGETCLGAALIEG